MITLTENVELVPHIQIIPKHFRADKSDFKPKKKNRKNKKSTRKQRKKEEQQQRLDYWNETFNELGIEDLPLLIPYDWQVPMHDINHEVLYGYILRGHRFGSSDKDEIWQEISGSARGGVSLCLNDELIYPSMCCSDLTNILDWRRAIDSNSQKWEMLWNGHPWLHSRYQDRQIRLTSLNARPPFKGKYAIDPQYLNQVVSRAEKRLAYFKKRIMTYWDENKYTMQD